jgi:hypothetical protein
VNESAAWTEESQLPASNGRLTFGGLFATPLIWSCLENNPVPPATLCYYFWLRIGPKPTTGRIWTETLPFHHRRPPAA